MNGEYFLGVDIGGTKTHALVADANGKAVGFGASGAGSWELVGYDGLTATLQEAARQALKMAGVRMEDLSGAGLGMAGYDWPVQKEAHLAAIAQAGLSCPLQAVNDAVLGIAAGAEQGWGVSVVSGTGCNCRGLSRDHRVEGRVVGGAGHWSGEAAGGFDILARAMRAVTYEWARRGPATALSTAFLAKTGARDLNELIEGTYLGRFPFEPGLIMLVFQSAHAGDPQALEVMRWAGAELGGMAVGVIHQLGLEKDSFDVVLIGSIFDGHPTIQQSLAETLHPAAPGARPVRLTVPPVVGGVLLGMEAAGMDYQTRRQALIASTTALLGQMKE